MSDRTFQALLVVIFCVVLIAVTVFWAVRYPPLPDGPAPTTEAPR